MQIAKDTATVGLRSVLRKMEQGEIEKVYLATDADSFLEYKVMFYCQKHNVPCVRSFTKAQIGNQMGLCVPSAVLGIKK